MAEAKTWSAIWDGSDGVAKLKLNFESTYDKSTNKSLLKLTSIQMQNTPMIGYPYYLDGVVEINGKAVIIASHNTAEYYATCNQVDTWYSVSKSTAEIEVPHDIDGGKSIAVSLVGRLDRDDYDGKGGYDLFTINNVTNNVQREKWTVDKAPKNFIIAEPSRGIVYIDDGAGFNAYQAYIDNGTSWDLYLPYIDNGTNWVLCS